MSSRRAQAKEHISTLREKRQLLHGDVVDLDNPNVADLNCTLAIASFELYADSFHFIWEIIQNNDDTEYNNQTPELSVVLTDDALYVWSNQAGFSETDVNSICGLGRSSKKAQTETIGEKGIGFKSLFTVADVVTIHSEPYHFAFDTTGSLGNLGMVIPTWIDEPASVVGHVIFNAAQGTTLVLRLKPEIHVAALRRELDTLDFAFLIFCRRLKKIQVSYRGKLGNVSKVGELAHQNDGTVVLQVRNSADASVKRRKFCLFARELRDMPPQPERPRQSTSTVRVAFPVPLDWEHGLIGEQTYAFMPMQGFGFNFMIHANFILTANRGEVIARHEWNIKLREGVADLIHSAIVSFATSADSPLTFQWPHYVKSLFSVHDNFFKPLAVAVRERLKTTPLLVTDAEDASFFQTPVQALRISDDFRVDDRLILDGNKVARKSVHRGYAEDSTTRHILEQLGVKGFNHDDFLREFETMVLDETLAFRHRSLPWHNAVASVLLAARRQSSNTFNSRCKDLAIVPLASGDWTAASADNLFLPSEAMQDVPAGLAVKVVDPAACADKPRRMLFAALGVRAGDPEQICEAILSDHRNRQCHTMSETVSALGFLFLSGYAPKSGDLFRFYHVPSRSDNAGRAKYIPFGKIGSAVREHLGTAVVGLNWLSSHYSRTVEEKQLQKFTLWLRKWPQLRLWPEVCRQHTLAPVMADLLAAEGSKALLNYFHLRVANGAAIPINDHLWRQSVSELEVSTDQGLKRLCETALPGVARLGGGMVPSLHLSNPDDPSWSFLADFGVMTSVDARFLLQKLRHIKSANRMASIKTKLLRTYLDLGKFAAEKKIIKKAFESESLIYVGEGGWAKPSSCRWTANYPFTTVAVLSDVYDGCSRLFKNILGLKAADLTDLLEELRTWTVPTGSDEIDTRVAETVYRLLLEMNRMIAIKLPTVPQMAQMKKLPMFPVSHTQPASGSMSLSLQRSTGRFWIGDIPWLQKCFYGKAPLLFRLPMTTIKDLDVIFNVLDMEKMKLTRCEFSEFVSDGTSGGTDVRLTKFLRPKIPYMISLLEHVRESADDGKRFAGQLKDLRLQRVRGIKIRRYIKDGTMRIYGVDEEGEICLKPESKRLVIHIDPDLQEPDVYDSLAEHLSIYWNLQHKSRQLLYKVLASTSPRRCIEAFERAGIVTADSDEASTQWMVSSQKSEGTGVKRAADVANRGGPGPAGTSHPTARQIKSPVARKLFAATTRWVDRTTNSHITDDTIFQYGQHGGGQRRATRPRRSFGSSRGVTAYDGSSMNRTRVSSSPGTFRHRPPSLQSLYRGHGMASNDFSNHFGNHFGNSPSKKRKLDTEEVAAATALEDARCDIGRAGERLVYKFLMQIVSPSPFSYRHWTSRNRNTFFPLAPFADDEADFADFTYEDIDEKLTDYFIRKIPGFAHGRPSSSAALQIPPAVDATDTPMANTATATAAAAAGKTPSNTVTTTTYHLEVKTSREGIEMPAMLSNNQIRLAQQFSKTASSSDVSSPPSPSSNTATAVAPMSPGGGPGSAPRAHNSSKDTTDVYVLVRVYDLDNPKVCFFPDPWDQICRGQLTIEGDEGVYVRPLAYS